MGTFHISRLASEILLFIFLNLDLHQLVLCRRVSKQFQEVIDNNQLLWRVFEWGQKDQESFRPALDMFDEYSQSSLEKVSVQEQDGKEEDLLHLIQVLNQSNNTLKEVELKVANSSKTQEQVVELLTTDSKLRSLVVWNWVWEEGRNAFPLSRLAPSKSRVQTSSFAPLQLLWGWDWFGFEDLANIDSEHLNSLVSFALGHPTSPQQCRELIGNFPETIVHLRLASTGFSTIKPPFCPNLKIFEGWVSDGVSSFLDAPHLKIVVMKVVEASDIDGLPPSVEEIWLRSRRDPLDSAEAWEPLLRQCPKLRILKLMEDFLGKIPSLGY